eukprot:gene2107-2596_t
MEETTTVVLSSTTNNNIKENELDQHQYLISNIDLGEPEYWKYKGEGACNIVLSYNGPSNKQLDGMVLRLRKYDPLSDIGTGTNLKKDIGDYKYVSETMTKLLGDEYVFPGKVVYVNKEFLMQVDKNVYNDRPIHRMKLRINVNSQVAFIIYDLTLFKDIPLPKEFDNSPVVCIEIKPKWGFITNSKYIKPTHRDIKTKTCRYCMHQYLKLAEGSISGISCYCPIDLFSGDPKKQKDAIKSMLLEPQNNLKLYYNGSLSFTGSLGGGKTDDSDINLNSISHLLNELFQNNGDGIESLSNIIATILQKEHVLDSLQKIQKYDDIDIEGIHYLYNKQLQSNRYIAGGGIIDSVELYKDLEKLTSVEIDKKINDFLISSTVKDCSIMISFISTNPTIESNNQSSSKFVKIQNQSKFETTMFSNSNNNNNNTIVYRVGLVDLDTKISTYHFNNSVECSFVNSCIWNNHSVWINDQFNKDDGFSYPDNNNSICFKLPNFINGSNTSTVYNGLIIQSLIQVSNFTIYQEQHPLLSLLTHGFPATIALTYNRLVRGSIGLKIFDTLEINSASSILVLTPKTFVNRIVLVGNGSEILMEQNSFSINEIYTSENTLVSIQQNSIVRFNGLSTFKGSIRIMDDSIVNFNGNSSFNKGVSQISDNFDDNNDEDDGIINVVNGYFNGISYINKLGFQDIVSFEMGSTSYINHIMDNNLLSERDRYLAIKEDSKLFINRSSIVFRIRQSSRSSLYLNSGSKIVAHSMVSNGTIYIGCFNNGTTIFSLGTSCDFGLDSYISTLIVSKRSNSTISFIADHSTKIDQFLVEPNEPDWTLPSNNVVNINNLIVSITNSTILYHSVFNVIENSTLICSNNINIGNGSIINVFGNGSLFLNSAILYDFSFDLVVDSQTSNLENQNAINLKSGSIINSTNSTLFTNIFLSESSIFTLNQMNNINGTLYLGNSSVLNIIRNSDDDWLFVSFLKHNGSTTSNIFLNFASDNFIIRTQNDINICSGSRFVIYLNTTSFQPWYGTKTINLVQSQSGSISFDDHASNRIELIDVNNNNERLNVQFTVITVESSIVIEINAGLSHWQVGVIILAVGSIAILILTIVILCKRKGIRYQRID